jgi:hypothetical protein
MEKHIAAVAAVEQHAAAHTALVVNPSDCRTLARSSADALGHELHDAPVVGKRHRREAKQKAPGGEAQGLM